MRAAPLLVFLGACAADAGDAPPVALDLLADARVVHLDVQASSSTLDGLEVPLAGGIWVAGVDDDALWIDELFLEHGTFGIGLDDMAGGGPWMASLALHLDEPLVFDRTMWTEGGELAMTGLAEAPAVIRWELLAPWPPVIAYDSDTVVSASASGITDDDAVRIILRGETARVTWEWGELELSSALRFTIEGSIARE